MVDFATALTLIGKGTPVLKAAYENVMARRRDQASKIIQRRMRSGSVWAISEDQAATLLIGYLRAAEDGAGSENLDLLAQVIASGEQEPTLVSARFKKWYRILADLSRDEILVLGRYIVGADSALGEGKHLYEVGTAGEKQAINDLVGEGKPLQFESEVRAHLSALQRIGVVATPQGWGADAPVPTPLLSELARLVDFGAAIQTGKDLEA